MEVEFRVEPDHLSRDDPAIEAAINKYTSPPGRLVAETRLTGIYPHLLLSEGG